MISETEPTDTTPVERFTISARTYQIVAVVALVLVAVIVVTGAAVRLTGSGMGCDTWPKCTDADLVRFEDPNQTIEQVNRLFTGLVSLAVIAAVLGSLRRRPYRRDLVWWALGLVGGVLGQIVLGGITVLVHLNPIAVGSHFVLSMILLSDATILLWKASHDPGPNRPRIGPLDLNLSRLAVFTACVLMITGPIVTGSGPHAGDADAKRFDFFIPDVVRIHSVNMWIFLIISVILLIRLGLTRTPADIMRRGYRLLAAIVVQGAIGYTQYELGIPPGIVILHIAGATFVVGFVVWFHMGLSAPQHPLTVSETSTGAATAPESESATLSPATST